MSSVSDPEPGAPAAAVPVLRWPHRFAALGALLICIAELPNGNVMGLGATATLALLPFLLLEGVSRLAAIRRSGRVLLTGAVIVAGSLILHAPAFSRGSGEWARLNFLFVPVVQLAGVLTLAGVLLVLRRHTAQR